MIQDINTHTHTHSDSGHTQTHSDSGHKHTHTHTVIQDTHTHTHSDSGHTHTLFDEVKVSVLRTRRAHGGEVLVPGPDPEGPVGAPVPEDHALRDGVTVDESFVSLLLKARRVPAPLHHLHGHLSHSKLVPVGHLRRLKETWMRVQVYQMFTP